MTKTIKLDSILDDINFDPGYFKESNMVGIEYIDSGIYEITGDDFEVKRCLKEMRRCKINFREEK